MSSDARYFGVDLSALWREVRKPWRGVREWPLFAWLTPLPLVRLLQADGQESDWLGAEHQVKVSGARLAKFIAVELPDDVVLRRTLTMPTMSDADTMDAVRLQVRSISPFPADELVWGYRGKRRGSDQILLEVALASRRQIDQYLADRVVKLEGATLPEVWVCAGQSAPIVLAGYGEDARAQNVGQARHLVYGLLLSAVILLFAAALTPTAQLWLRTKEAAQSYGALVARTKPHVREREVLLQSVEQLKTLSDVLSDRIEPLRVIEKLTQVLPDDTSLQSLRLQSTTVTITGLTENASTLMQLLGTQPGLRDVHATSAATRPSGANKESFVIVFSLDPKTFGSASLAEVAAASETPAAPVAPAPPATTPTAPTIPAPVNASPSPSPAAASPFAVGGGSPKRNPASSATTGGSKP